MEGNMIVHMRLNSSSVVAVEWRVETVIGRCKEKEAVTVIGRCKEKEAVAEAVELAIEFPR